MSHGLRSARHVQTKMTHEAATYPDNTIPQLSLGEPALVGKLYVLNLYYVTGGWMRPLNAVQQQCIKPNILKITINLSCIRFDNLTQPISFMPSAKLRSTIPQSVPLCSEDTRLGRENSIRYRWLESWIFWCRLSPSMPQCRTLSFARSPQFLLLQHWRLATRIRLPKPTKFGGQA